MLKTMSVSKTLLITALTFTMLFTPGFVPQAEAASLSLAFGGGFRIGGVFFNVGVHSRGGEYHDHYYRTSRQLSYDGYSCNRACYREGDYTYHHRACPLVSHHFNRYGYDGYDVFNSYAPRYAGRSYYDQHRSYDRHDRYDRHHRSNGRYDRHDRYDRRDRYDRDDRRDRHDRRDRRRH